VWLDAFLRSACPHVALVCGSCCKVLHMVQRVEHVAACSNLLLIMPWYVRAVATCRICCCCTMLHMLQRVDHVAACSSVLHMALWYGRAVATCRICCCCKVLHMLQCDAHVCAPQFRGVSEAKCFETLIRQEING